MNKFESCGNKLINTLGIKLEIDIKEEPLKSHEEYFTVNDVNFGSLKHQIEADIDVKIEDEAFVEDQSHNLNSDMIMMADINMKKEDHEDLIKIQNLTLNNDVIPKHISLTEEKILFHQLEKSKFPIVFIPKLNVEVWKKNFAAKRRGIKNESKKRTRIFDSSPPKVKIDDLKKRLRGLKGTSRRRFRKSTATKSAATEMFVSKYPYYKYLLFLKETTTSRNLKGNIPNTSASDLNPMKKNAIADSPISNSPKPTTVDDLSLPPQENMQSTGNKIQMIESSDEKLLIEKNKLRNDNANDSDYQFLMSLLPYMREIPNSRKLLIRGKLLQVFINDQHLQRHLLRSSRIANIHEKGIGN